MHVYHCFCQKEDLLHCITHAFFHRNITMEDDEYEFDRNDSLSGSAGVMHRIDRSQSSIFIDKVETQKKCEFIQLNNQGGTVKLVIGEGFLKKGPTT